MSKTEHIESHLSKKPSCQCNMYQRGQTTIVCEQAHKIKIEVQNISVFEDIPQTPRKLYSIKQMKAEEKMYAL